jgi:hypothetical protein
LLEKKNLRIFVSNDTQAYARKKFTSLPSSTATTTATAATTQQLDPETRSKQRYFISSHGGLKSENGNLSPDFHWMQQRQQQQQQQ